MSETQRVLSEEATEAFDHGWLFPAQVEHFAELTMFSRDQHFRLLDVGGGTGRFAESLQERFPNCATTILDLSPGSVQKAQAKGIAAVYGSILEPPPALFEQPFDVVSFNMVLHHLVGDSAHATRKNQVAALAAARALLKPGGRVVVNEYCYTGLGLPDLSGWLIFVLTSSKALAGTVETVGKLIPNLRANTVGVGVRFRPLASWLALAAEAGLAIGPTIPGPMDSPSVLRRALLLIREIRRSSAIFVSERRRE